MDSIKINQMLAAANGANHVGEYPAGSYSPMPNKVGTIHAVCDLLEILELRAQVEKLQSENAAILQEAKIHASELDTQKSIIAELCGLLSLRVHDYHCVSKVKEALAARDAEVATKAVEQFANVVFDESLKKRKGLLPVLSLAKEFNEAQRTGKLPPLLPHVG